MLQWIQNIDNNLIGFIQSSLHTPLLDQIMPLISLIGNLGTVWVVIAVIFLFIPRYRKFGIMVICAVLFTTLTGEVVIKQLVQRIRPCNLNSFVPMLIPRPLGFSFPSGHTSSSFAATMILWKANKKFGAFALMLAVLIAFSRMYLYVHFPTDILAGIALGLLCGLAAIYIVSAIYKKKWPPHPHRHLKQ